MKKSLIVTSLLFGVTLNAQVFKGCGDTKDKARENLAKNIITKVDSTTSSNKSRVGDDYSSNISINSKQSTNITLSGLQFTTQNHQYCTTISDDKLKSHTNSLIKKVLAYELSLLPQTKQEKLSRLTNWISDTKEALSLSALYNKTDKNKQLLKNLKSFIDQKTKIQNNNRVKFIVNGDVEDLKILVDNKPLDNNTEAVLTTGKHQYKIQSTSHCPKQAVIDVKDDQVINIDMQDYWFPSLTITSNQSDAKLKIDGETHKLGKKKIFKDCSGKNINYEVSFEDKLEKSEFKLSVNNHEERNYDFISKEYEKIMFQKADSYSKGARLEVKYAFRHITADDDYKDYENISAGQINYLKFNNWFRYGWGIEYGETQNSKIQELYYMVALQIPTTGDDALSIGKVVLVPFIGGKIGGGKHELYNTKTGVIKDTFQDIDSTDDDRDYKKDYGVASVVAGFDIAVTKQLGFNFFVEKAYSMEKSLTYGLGLSLKLW